MKKLLADLKWHIAVMVFCVLVFSILCWIEFAKSAVSKIQEKLEIRSVSEESSYTAVADQYIDKFDLAWKDSIFKKRH